MLKGNNLFVQLTHATALRNFHGIISIGQPLSTA
ncbi:MAG: hypothetical protein RLZZ198_600 [Bacteroidota bacterium]|jgi:hypothetical protein